MEVLSVVGVLLAVIGGLFAGMIVVGLIIGVVKWVWSQFEWFVLGRRPRVPDFRTAAPVTPWEAPAVADPEADVWTRKVVGSMVAGRLIGMADHPLARRQQELQQAMVEDVVEWVIGLYSLRAHDSTLRADDPKVLSLLKGIDILVSDLNPRPTSHRRVAQPPSAGPVEPADTDRTYRVLPTA